jgi:cell division protein FtsB
MNQRAAIALFAVMLTALQWRLWVADGGITDTARLKQQITESEQELQIMKLRNAALEAEVQDLDSGKAAIESRARVALGMIRPEETFYLVVE